MDLRLQESYVWDAQWLVPGQVGYWTIAQEVTEEEFSRLLQAARTVSKLVWGIDGDISALRKTCMNPHEPGDGKGHLGVY